MCCNQSEILLYIFNAQEGPEAKAKVKLGFPTSRGVGGGVSHMKGSGGDFGRKIWINT